ncbi:uncharacterized protein BO80DRAFT_362572, partial [Aspergillus ibericus CBS 121593]
FEYIIILFKSTNTLVIFRNYIYIIFYKLFDNFYILYLNNILIFLLHKNSI